MTDTFKGIITADGKKRQLPYGSILDKPVSDETLSIQGGFADAKVVGNKFNEVKTETNSLKSGLDRLNEGGLNLKDEVIEQNINNWLNEHPEATTTVQDGVITEPKIHADFLPYIKNEYVTPEMFGAVGDGVTNDLEAFQTALLQPLPIHLFDKHYKIDGDLFITVQNTCILGKTGGYSDTSPRLSFVNGHGLYINESIYNVRLNGFAIFSDGIGLTMQGENRPGNIVIEDIFFRCKRDVLIDTETGYIYFNKCHFNFNSDTEFDGDLVKIAYAGNGSNRANYIYFNQCAFEGSSIPYSKSNYLIHLDNCSNINFIQCDMCNCYNVIDFGTIGPSQYINLVNNYIWNCRTIANIASPLFFVMTGNSHYTPSGTQPLVFPSQRRGHVITGNIFPNWGTVSVENKGTIFANNYIGGEMSDEVLSRLHIGEIKY